MGGAADDFPKCSVASQEDEAAKETPSATPVADSLSNVLLSDAPIIFLVKFHKALRSELSDLRRLTLSASENGSFGGDLVPELLRRFELLKIAYKYHFAAEEEIIFPALDVHTKNVAGTYILEHESIDNLFNSIFHLLDELKTEETNVIEPFQELVLCLGTIQSSMCRHMLKEEEQVYPLLMQQLSTAEQASLMWQFICSVPVILLEDLLPWMMSFLSSDEQREVKQWLEDILPRETLLQEVVVSWLGGNKIPSTEPITRDQCQGGNENRENPIDGLHLWHRAIIKDVEKILDELSQLRLNELLDVLLLRRADSLPNLDSIIVRIKFLADVVVFYSNALEKLFYPVISQLSDVSLPSTSETFLQACNMEGLQRLLHCNVQDSTTLLSRFLQNLRGELESFFEGIKKKISTLETEVFPDIRKNCNYKMQQQLLYMSLHTLPLGLLKCVTTWFSAHLSEDELRSFFQKIQSERSRGVDNSFESLLHEWFRIAYLGKSSPESFGLHLEQMFKTRNFFLNEKFNGGSGSSSLSSNVQSCEASSFVGVETLYSSGINMRIYFPEAMKISQPFPKLHDENHPDGSPIDIILFFHKALKKDLDYLVSCSFQLAEKVEILDDFRRRFQFFRVLHQIHSDAEDQIAFPALETKGQVENICDSYIIDHKLEMEYFGNISSILDELTELQASGLDKTDQEISRHEQICLGLQIMFKSLHKLLIDHINHEDIEIWPLFKELFSIEEQEQIIGSILGRTRAEMLEDMIPWLMEYITPIEQWKMMSLWRKVTRHTMFDQWLAEWWEGIDAAKPTEVSNDPPAPVEDPLELVLAYLSKEVLTVNDENLNPKTVSFLHEHLEYPEQQEMCNNKVNNTIANPDTEKCSEDGMVIFESDEKKGTDFNEPIPESRQSKHQKHILAMSQEDLEAAVRKICSDSSLNLQEKSFIMQNLMTSPWTLKQRLAHSAMNLTRDDHGIQGHQPSYRDSHGQIFGCKHYKRNCKLFAPCCNRLYTCIHCHDDETGHSVERKHITKMLCMKCLVLQPIGSTCSTVSCASFSMAKYFCRICKVFDDDRNIYHCPYCNICRVGKGLGKDYFHCMNCNACMSWKLAVHICREKCLEDNCPICHEYIFTSTAAVKQLPCGHIMHSDCFLRYTETSYICPICCKSLGDMQVYFRMLDTLLEEEKIPDEYADKTQAILCNDCEKRGTARFHWCHLKCPQCGSYNTRPL